MPHSPTHRVVVLLGDEERSVSFHPSKPTAFAFADGVAWGANLAGGDVHPMIDASPPAWRGRSADGRVLRIQLVELPADVVTIPDAEYAEMFG